MLGSVDLVGPRRLVRVLRSARYLDSNALERNFPKEGDLPGARCRVPLVVPVVSPCQGAV